MPYVNDTGYPSVTDILSPWIDKTWFTDEHRDRGSAVHAACAAHLQGLYIIPLKPEWQPYFDSFRRWCDMVVDKVLFCEKRLIDANYEYCGKPDAVIIMKGSDEEVLIDFKTSQSKQVWWLLQMSAYAWLLDENGLFYVPKCASVRLKKDGSGCLFNDFYNWGTFFDVFKNALATYQFMKG